MCCLNEINPGEIAYITSIGCPYAMRRRLFDLGLVEKTRIECIGRSPFGDPTAYLIRGAVIALRREDCNGIFVSRKVD